MPGTVGLGAEGGFRKPEDNNSGGGTLDLPDLGRDISNWTGNVGRAAKGGLEDIVHANYKKDSGNWAGDLEQWGTDAANIARGGFNQADWWAKRNLSETGLDNSWGDALGTMNTAGKILNGIYSYAGGPTFNIGNMQVGQSGPTINWQDTLNNLDTGIAHELTNEVRSVGRDIFEGGKPTGPGHWVTKYSTAGTATPGGEIDKHQTSQRVWVPDQKSPDFWHQAAHGAMSAVQAAFDTPQHMYRAAVLAYQKYGWDGVTAVLAPAVAGAAAGAMVGNPEVGAVAADTAGATAASSAADVATADATASTAEGAAASVAQEAPAVGPTVAQEQAMRPVTSAAERFMNSPIGRASKLVGYPVKTVNQAMTSPVLAGAQIPDYAYHFSNGPMGDIWRQAQHAHGDLTTIGRGLSQWVYGKPDTWLSGTTDAIATLISTPYEFGRALHLSETGARVLTVADSTAVDTAFNKSAGYRRALTQILDMAHGGSGKAVQENLAGAIARSMPSLEPIAADLAKAAAKDGATEYSLSRRIGEMADASRMTQTTNLPTLGLYGISKMKARLSDSFVPSWLSRTFGQSPMALDDLKQIMTTRSIRLGEPNAGFKLGELLQQTGMKSGDITRLVNHLVTTRDLTEWESAIKSALKENFYQRIDRRFISALGMNSEEFAKAFREGNLTDEQVAELDSKLRQPEAASVYMKLRKAISNKVDELVGDSKAGKDGALFGYDGYGMDLSKLDRGGTAAITENQRGELHLPNFQQIDKELGDFFKQMGRVNSPEARFGDMISRGSARTEELLNEYVNDRWFKPLALLTPGWAFRVSLSELMLNTARLGPGNILAGALTRGMVKRQREAFYLADQSANKTIRELEGRASSLEKNIADEATKETPNFGAVQRWQEEHAALRRHIDWLHSPASTEAPMMERDLSAGGALVPPETVQHFLESKGYKLNKTEIGNLTALAHGIAIGTRQAMLTAIGKEEFVKNAAYLMYRHGGYLPGAVDSVHKSWLDHVDLSGDYVEEVKTKRAYDEAGLPVPKRDRKGNLKTKLVLMSPTEFAGTSFGQHRYFEGWFYGANTLAGSEYLGRPLAKAYLDLLGKGLQGNDLHIAAVNEATKIINDLPENVRLTMVRHLVPGAGHNEPVSSWAETLTSRLEGVASKPIRQGKLTEEEITNGIDNRDVTYQPHVELLRDISNNFLPSHVNNFYEEYAFFPDGAARGKDYMPETVASRTPQLYSKSDFISRLSTYGHSKVLGPMVNYLTRQPTYIAEFIMERKNLEEKVAKGILTPDQADIVAETAATRRMTRYIHNPEDKTRFEQTMSVYAPFYFAQNQAWRRMGRLFAENPGAFMQYLTVMLGVQDWVTKVTNQNGISMYTLPGLAMYGLPFTASLSSLQTMDPFSPTPDMGQGTNKTQTILDLIAPKFGPVVTVPAKLVNYFLPSTTHGQGAWLSRQLEGNIAMGETASQFFYQSAIPNSLIRNLVELPVGYAESSRTGGTALDFMDNAYFQAVSESIRYTVQAESKQYWDFLNSKGVHDQNGNSLSPYEKSVAFYEWQAQHWNPNTMTGQHSLQYLLDSSRQKAGILWMAKILGGFVSPVTINVGNANMDMVNKLQKMTASKKFGGDYLRAVDAFTKEYPWATIDTLAKSTSTYGGYAPETKTYYNWLGQHEYLATSAPLAAPAFAPDSGKDTKYFQPAHNLLLQLGLRQRETPWQFLDSFMISTGNSFYYNWIKPQYEQYRTQDKSAAYKWRQSMMTWYGTNYNTTWLASYNEGLSTIRKQQTLTQATEVLADPQKYGVTIDPQNKAVLSLLMQQIQGGNGKPGAYQELQTEIKSGKLNSVDASTAWQNWLDGWIKKYPESKQAIMTLFYNLG